MERKNLAQELRRWVVEEMGLPAQKAPSEETLQRLFIGQCADIWKFIIRHVYNQRNVRKIEGNLLWYQQLQRSEAQRSVEEQEQQRRKKLCKEILELRSELQHLQDQIQSAEREIIKQEHLSIKAQDYCRRSVLLQAFNRKSEQEYASLNETNLKIEARCEQIQKLKRISQRELLIPDLDPNTVAGTSLEPDVLRDVRAVCQTRFQFLQSLYHDAVKGTVLPGWQEVRTTAHQQWMTMAEKVWISHPANHIMIALEHLAMETSHYLKAMQTSGDDDPFESSGDEAEMSTDIQEQDDAFQQPAPRRYSSGSDSSYVLPTFRSMIQDGWAETVRVSSQLRAVQKQVQTQAEQLADIIQVVHRNHSDEGELSRLMRSAFDVELQTVVLRGTKEALLRECRILQDESATNMDDVGLLEQQKNSINYSNSVLLKKQQQIQILISGNRTSKDKIRCNTVMAENSVLQTLLPQPQEVIQQAQRLKDSILKEVKHFSAVSLPTLMRVCPDRVNWVPIHQLSINRLYSTNSSYFSTFKELYETIGLPLYKAPETVLTRICEMRRDMYLLRCHLKTRNQSIKDLQRRLQENNPDTETLLQQLSAHYDTQVNQLVPKLKQLTEQCERSQEYGKHVQATLMDWWEQPAQLCLPGEQRAGLTLRQWRDRWTVAATALQTASSNQS